MKMKTLLALALGIALAQETETPDPAARIEALLRRLDDDDVKTRTQAGEELIAIGEPALPAVRKVLAGSESAEVRAWAGEIVVAILRKGHRGGPAVAGFSAALRADQEVVEVGAELKLALEIRNVSSGPREFIPAGVLDGHTHGLGGGGSPQAHAILLVAPSNVAIPAVPESIIRFGLPEFRDAVSRKSVRLESGQVWKREITLRVGEEGIGGASSKGYQHAREYQVQVLYYAAMKRLLDGARADLPSTIVRFRVGTRDDR